MRTTYDIELLDLLKVKIQEGRIKVHENVDLYFGELEDNYPIGFSGIDWTKKEVIYYKNLSENKLDLSEKVKQSINDILKIFPDLLSENIVVFADGLITLGFEMSFYDFYFSSTYFSDLPQHTYIWFTKIKKCINLTFENEVYFG